MLQDIFQNIYINFSDHFNLINLLLFFHFILIYLFIILTILKLEILIILHQVLFLLIK